MKFETRKQFSPRTSLSLLSDYDWYSWVPSMRYNDADGNAKGIVNGTQIADGDAFSPAHQLPVQYRAWASRALRRAGK